LGVIPLGTVNVFAKEIGLPMRLSEAWEVILAGRTRTVDLGRAEFSEGASPAQRYFVQMAGAGLDARAVELVHWEHKKRWGKLAYIFAALRAVREHLPPITVTVGQESLEGQLVLVGNGRFYGGRFVLFPEADPEDGVLEVTVFPRVNWAAVARVGWNVLTGRSPAAGLALHLRGQSARLSCPVAVPFQLEGDNVGRLPLSCTVRAGALRVLAP
jgi:diacylglycerol kinase family enzyme